MSMLTTADPPASIHRIEYARAISPPPSAPARSSDRLSSPAKCGTQRRAWRAPGARQDDGRHGTRAQRARRRSVIEHSTSVSPSGTGCRNRGRSAPRSRRRRGRRQSRCRTRRPHRCGLWPRPPGGSGRRPSAPPCPRQSRSWRRPPRCLARRWPRTAPPCHVREPGRPGSRRVDDSDHEGRPEPALLCEPSRRRRRPAFRQAGIARRSQPSSRRRPRGPRGRTPRRRSSLVRRQRRNGRRANQVAPTPCSTGWVNRRGAPRQRRSARQWR